MAPRKNVQLSFDIGPEGWTWRAQFSLNGTGHLPGRWVRRSILGAGVALAAYVFGVAGHPALGHLLSAPR